jgi:dethiobiotin synthetase
MSVIGITGTDTAVGKTVVACAICVALCNRGARVGVMKPVETGVAGSTHPSDAHALVHASRCAMDLQLIRPYTFAPPVAPMVAARLAGTEIEYSRLAAALQTIAELHDFVVIEGAGGLLVPLSPVLNFATLFSRFAASLVIVARNRLGAVNHTLLTLSAAREAGLGVAAVVVHDDAPGFADEASHSNVPVLTELAAPVRVFHFPWAADPTDRDSLAAAAEASGMIDHLLSMKVGVTPDSRIVQ